MIRISALELRRIKEFGEQNKLHFCQSYFGIAKVLLVLVLLVGRVSYGQESESLDEIQSAEEEKSETGEVLVTEEPQLVEVKEALSINNPYKERRDRWGVLFSIGAENLYVSEYESIIDGNFYEDLFGSSDLTFLEGELGLKYNFQIGSIALSAGFGMGSVTDDRIGQERSIELQKQYAGLTMYFDNLMKEPYVVPYIGGQVWVMNISEEILDTEESHAITSGIGFSFKVGTMFQLNWLDNHSAQSGYNDHHIENTYLDVYVTQNASTSDEEDPNLSSDFNWGAGLKIEF